MSNTPSDAEILALAQQHLKAFSQFTGAGEVWFEGEVEFARAVIAKWGTPPVVREPLTKEQRSRIVLTADTVSEAIDMVERHHGIKGGQHGANN